MLYEILPDPRAFVAAKGQAADMVLQIHRAIPEQVPVGHFEEGGVEVVDEVVSREVYLERIQRACAELGESLELRFYDHFEEEFDASVLDRLDEVRRLAIDGLESIRNADAIGRLPRLTSLLFGPRRVVSAGILDEVGLPRLTHFTLAGTPTPALDLSPLGDAHALRSLRLLGHGKNTETIGKLRSLSELALQPPARFAFESLNGLEALESLKLVLGRAASLTALGGLPSLRDFSLFEVHLLEDVGDLQRFPRLRRLQLSDLPRITNLQVGRLNEELEHIYLHSLPQLQELQGFGDLPAIKSLFAYDTRLELPWPELPTSLSHFQLMTKRIKGREVWDAGVRARGLNPAIHPDAVFFYK